MSMYEDQAFDKVVEMLVGLTRMMTEREVGILVATLGSVGACLDVDDALERPSERIERLISAIKKAHP